MSDKIDAVTLDSQRKCLFINSKSKMIQMEYKKTSWHQCCSGNMHTTKTRLMDFNITAKTKRKSLLPDSPQNKCLQSA